MDRIGFLGAGKMATALASAFLREAAAGRDDIICADISAEQRDTIGRSLGVRVTKENRTVLAESDVVVLAIKPQNFAEAVAGLTAAVRKEQVIISIMAGVRIEAIRAALPGRVVRVMPNTACLVGQMAAGFAAAEDVSEEDIARVRRLLECAGVAVEVSEEQMDAVTGLSGSGPAFVAHLAASFIGAGIEAGLSEEVARVLTLKTFEGTVCLLSEHIMAPEELVRMVSSPNGTTVAGLEILTASDVAEVIRQTVLRATERSIELGK